MNDLASSEPLASLERLLNPDCCACFSTYMAILASNAFKLELLVQAVSNKKSLNLLSVTLWRYFKIRSSASVGPVVLMFSSLARLRCSLSLDMRASPLSFGRCFKSQYERRNLDNGNWSAHRPSRSEMHESPDPVPLEKIGVVSVICLNSLAWTSNDRQLRKCPCCAVSFAYCRLEES